MAPRTVAVELVVPLQAKDGTPLYEWRRRLTVAVPDERLLEAVPARGGADDGAELRYFEKDLTLTVGKRSYPIRVTLPVDDETAGRVLTYEHEPVRIEPTAIERDLVTRDEKTGQLRGVIKERYL